MHTRQTLLIVVGTAVALAVAAQPALKSLPTGRTSWRGVAALTSPAGRSRCIVAAGLAAAVAGIGWGVGAFLTYVGVLAVVGVVAVLLTRQRARRIRRRREVASIEFCDALAAELSAGLPAVRALAHACEAWPEWKPVAGAVGLGAEVPGALRVAAAQPGASGLAAIAAAWEVAGHSGAALADVLDRIGQLLRNEEEARAETAAALGPPRATARMLAVLPVFGIGLGTSMGANPLGFMLHHPIGRGCLVLGLLLAVAGLWWVEKLADAAEA